MEIIHKNVKKNNLKKILKLLFKIQRFTLAHFSEDTLYEFLYQYPYGLLQKPIEKRKYTNF